MRLHHARTAMTDCGKQVYLPGVPLWYRKVAIVYTTGIQGLGFRFYYSY